VLVIEQKRSQRQAVLQERAARDAKLEIHCGESRWPSSAMTA